MTILTTIISFFGTTLGRYAIIGGGILVAWISFASHYKSKGAQKERARIERATDNATDLGRRAATKSRSGGVRAQRDPTTRDD